MFVRVYCFHALCLSIYGHLSSCLIQQNKTNMEKNIIQVALSIQVQFLFFLGGGEQGNKQIIFREQGNKRKIILSNKAIYFRGTGEQGQIFQGIWYPPGRASVILGTDFSMLPSHLRYILIFSHTEACKTRPVTSHLYGDILYPT